MNCWHIALLEPYAMQLRLDEHDLWECRTARVLRGRGYDVYYPAMPRKTHRQHRVPRISMEPMFPGYMMIRESPRGWEGLRATTGIRHGALLINPATQRLAVLPEEEIWRIAATETRLIDQELNPPPREPIFKIGDRVKFVEGVWADSKDPYATIETLDAAGRIALLKAGLQYVFRVYASPDQLVLAPAVV